MQTEKMTAQEIADMCKAHGMKRGNVLMTAEGYRHEANLANQRGNEMVGVNESAARAFFAEQDDLNDMAARTQQAAYLM